MAQARRDAGLETTRRDLLAGAVGTGAGLLLPSELSAAPKQRRGGRKVDVAIVGAGLAGLAAARRLARAGTETATYWNGYMDGSVRSGEKAAAEALQALRRGGR